MQEGQRWKSLLSSLATPATAQYALPGLISPSSEQESLYRPLGKRPEALPPRVPPPSLPSSPKGKIRLTGPTGQGVMMLLTCVYVHNCVTVIAAVRSSVNARFVHPIVGHIHLQCVTSKPNISSQKECVTMR